MSLIKSWVAPCAILLLSGTFVSCKKSESVKPVTPGTPDVPTTKEYRAVNIAVPATGLIAYWSFDNNGNDFSGNGNNGSLKDVSSTADRFGNPLGAYHFEGTNQSYITIPDNEAMRLNNADFTLSAWIKLDRYNYTNGCHILCKRISGSNAGWSWGLGGTGGTAPAGVNIFGPGSDGLNAVGTKPVTLNKWHMVTATYNYGTEQLSIYIDGVLDNISNNIKSPNFGVDPVMFIGKDNPVNGTFYPFEGSMDDISIYNSELSASTVAKLYKASANAASPGLIAYWPFDNSGDDLSGNWNNGAIHKVSSTADRFDNPLGAYHFDGTDTYISVPDKTALRLNNTDFTLNAWVNIDDYNSNLGSLLLSKNSGPSNGWLWGIAGKGVRGSFVKGSVTYGLGSNGQYVPGKVAVSLYNWHMVTSVYYLSTQQLSIYIDGVLDRTISGVPTPNATTATQLYIGRNDPGLSGNNFQGAMDEVSIYNSALSLSSIQQLYVATH